MPGNGEFTKEVMQGLSKCGVNLKLLAAQKKSIGVAVSGGADSVSLLISLCSICKDYSIPLKVITVNHYIRSDKETCGDVKFVKSLCGSLCDSGFKLTLKIHELKKGAALELAQSQKCGVEAAARELRYAAFEDFINEEKLEYLCLAHNKNDQMETLLMRFLQGAGGNSKNGIPCVRQKYIRPLLWTERSKIEAYLKENKIEWCTDSSNTDTAYLRNRIRAKLIPLLNDQFEGWDKAVLSGFEKSEMDAGCLQTLAQNFFEKHARCGKEIKLDAPEFYSLHRALKMRVLLLAFNALGVSSRVPFVFLRDICDYADNYNGGESQKTFAELSVICKKKEVLIKKACQVQKEIVFSVIIEESGMYELPFCRVEVPQGLDFPVLLRSWQMDDSIQTADGGTKKVNDVLSDWHVEESLKKYIPVVQALKEREQRILCILGSCMGYSDWIVKMECEK